MNTIKVLSVLLLNAFFSHTYAAAVLVNGGFETGDFTGWTEVSNTGGVACNADWYVSATDTQCQQSSNTILNSAVEGNYAAYNAFDGFSGTQYTIEQDFSIGTVSSATIDFSYTVGWNFKQVPTEDRIFSLSLLDSGDNLISDLFSVEVGLSDGKTGFIDWTDVSLDIAGILAGYENQTLTLVANVSIFENKTGAGSLGFDAIDLDVVPVSAVPLPPTAYLFGAALFFLGFMKRSKQKQSSVN